MDFFCEFSEIFQSSFFISTSAACFCSDVTLVFLVFVILKYLSVENTQKITLFCRSSCLEKHFFLQIYMKTTLIYSFLSTTAGPQPAPFPNQGIYHRRFPASFVKILISAIYRTPDNGFFCYKIMRLQFLATSRKLGTI